MIKTEVYIEIRKTETGKKYKRIAAIDRLRMSPYPGARKQPAFRIRIYDEDDTLFYAQTYESLSAAKEELEKIGNFEKV